MRRTFINEAFTQAINDYLANHESQTGIVYNSFLVVCLRLLKVIYGEADIINPFNANNADVLKTNLGKFGYPIEKIDAFFADLDAYYAIEKENRTLSIKKANPYFITVQKDLIDMLITKKINFHLLNEEIEEFYESLYTPDCHDPLMVSYNYLTAADVYEIKNYFIEQMASHTKVEEEATKNYLNNRSYEIMGYSMDQIKTLTEEELEKMNHQVYDYFKIRENAINKEYLLEKAIEEFDHTREPLTSGNGYVDILLVMSVIVTIIMVGTIVTFLVF